MTFALTSEQKLLRAIASASCMRSMRHGTTSAALSARTHTLTSYIKRGLTRACSASRFPSKYGGSGGPLLDLAIVVYEIAYNSIDFQMSFGGCVFCGLNILRKGSEEQKQYWLPKLINGERRMSISISEPEAGSDVGAIRTRAIRDGDAFIVNGQKVWNTGAGARDLTLNVYLKTDPAVHYRKGMSLFLIDNNSPGVSFNKLDMLGRRSHRDPSSFLQRRSR